MLEAPFYATDRINGTGDSLSACIAAELAKGETVEAAIRIAKQYVNQAIKEELFIGHKWAQSIIMGGKYDRLTDSKNDFKQHSPDSY